MVGLEPYVSECEARRIPPAPAKRRPVLPRLAELALSRGTVLPHRHPPPFSSSQLTCPRHPRISHSRCATHLSTCTLSCTTFASRTYERLRSTFSRPKRRPTLAHSPCCLSARRCCSTQHGST